VPEATTSSAPTVTVTCFEVTPPVKVEPASMRVKAAVITTSPVAPEMPATWKENDKTDALFGTDTDMTTPIAGESVSTQPTACPLLAWVGTFATVWSGCIAAAAIATGCADHGGIIDWSWTRT